MADEGWWIDKRPGGAVAYTRPSTWAKTVEFNLGNKGPLRMTSKKPGDDVTKHEHGGRVGGFASRNYRKR